MPSKGTWYKGKENQKEGTYQLHLEHPETVPQAGSERPESRKALDRCPDIEKDMRLANTCKSLSTVPP
ncbi:hypothetical protein KY284_027310 [Solanum tuberosum]|nr:hypothetical protein KY284_027310 [Solanum tuberosum]